MDRQTIFNKAANHMLTQGRKALKDDDDLCAYENSQGLMCAMGVFFPPNHPARHSHLGIDGVLDNWPELNEIFQCEIGDCDSWAASDIRFLIGLQNIHDSVDVVHWRDSLNNFAKNHGLEGIGE